MLNWTSTDKRGSILERDMVGMLMERPCVQVEDDDDESERRDHRGIDREKNR
jgi:hypothetical protein